MIDSFEVVTPGMSFRTLEECDAWFIQFASITGFVSRKVNTLKHPGTNTPRARLYGCSSKDCQLKIWVNHSKRENSWKVSQNLSLAHNHAPLSSDQLRLHPARRFIPDDIKECIFQWDKAGIGVKQFRSLINVIFKGVPIMWIEQDIYNEVSSKSLEKYTPE